VAAVAAEAVVELVAVVLQVPEQVVQQVQEELEAPELLLHTAMAVAPIHLEWAEKADAI
jgi:hypothetical protein